MDFKKKNSFQFEGKSVDEAIKKATEALNVSRDDMNIRIVSEEKKGLFGMEGEKPAKIIVELKKQNKN
jgi:predicted RNA-binding protein Jag